VEKFILKQSQNRVYLVTYLKKTLCAGIVDKIYYPAIEEFKSLLTQQINKNWE
jgi:hypothetical protein